MSRHKITHTTTDDVYIPDGRYCNGKDIDPNGRPCSYWDNSGWRCAIPMCEPWLPENIEGRIGCYAVHRMNACVARFGMKEGE